MSTKERAMDIFQQHIELASTDGRAFRAKVIAQLQVDLGCSGASAANIYNTCKKSVPPIPGLGRAPAGKGVRKMGKGRHNEEIVPDDECFTVLELLGQSASEDMTVGRCQSFLYQGEASEVFDEKVAAWPHRTWVMITGLGPVSTDTFKLGEGETEIKRYSPVKVAA